MFASTFVSKKACELIFRVIQTLNNDKGLIAEDSIELEGKFGSLGLEVFALNSQTAGHVFEKTPTCNCHGAPKPGHSWALENQPLMA